MKKTNAFLPESIRARSRKPGPVTGQDETSVPRSPVHSGLNLEVEHRKTVAEDLDERSRQSPAELFRTLSAAEQAVNDSSLLPFKNAITKSLHFRKALFETAPVINPCSPFPPKVDLSIRTQLWQGQKYREILDHFKQIRGREGRLFVMAWWLKGEGVCEPEDILGRARFQRLVKRICGRISDADFRRADQVRTWLPYFRRLLQDRRDQESAKLIARGYRPDAVLSCERRRSAVEAVCDWLASRPEREGIDAPSFRNAYSRMYGPNRRPSPATGSSGARGELHKKRKLKM